MATAEAQLVLEIDRRVEDAREHTRAMRVLFTDPEQLRVPLEELEGVIEAYDLLRSLAVKLTESVMHSLTVAITPLQEIIAEHSAERLAAAEKMLDLESEDSELTAYDWNEEE